ncbi:MAG: DUF349 domain-containing protein [Bacteroidota bacterium]
MKPEDLKNPDGLKSTQNEDDKSGLPADNEGTKKEAPAKRADEKVENVTRNSAGNEAGSKPEEGKSTDLKADEADEPMQKNSGNDATDKNQNEQKPDDENVNDSASKDQPEENGKLADEEEKADAPEEEAETSGLEESDTEKEAEVSSVANEEDASEKEQPAAEKEPEKKQAEESSSKKAESGEKTAASDKDAESGKKEKREDAAKAEPQQEVEKQDYASYTLIELINELNSVLDNNGDHDIKEEVEAIKAAFYKKVSEEVEEQKKQFIEEGGVEEEFQEQENPYEQDMKELLKRYRQVRHEFNKKLEEEKEVNLQQKYNIIEEIKGLIHKEESINKTFQEFRDLQQKWREIGPVPQAKMKDLWDLYHFHVENFYDYIKINQELRDLDLKKNLEVKIRLCEQAEELLLESNTIKAFNQLQKLHDRWREVGPVPRENKDDIWERFKAATSKINKKYQDFFEERKQEQKKNLEAKKALCEKVEEINEMEIDSHKEWSEKSKEVVNLQKVWRTIGFAPRKDNNKIYSRFREACDKFFDAKREFYSKNKELQQNNLQMKTDLCLQAEALKESTDWRKATQDLINIQRQWKEIGPVPRKYSDPLWKRFRAACDYFFEKKSEHFSEIDSEQVDNLNKKLELIKEVENFKSTGNVDENLRHLKDFQRRWTEIGHVPIKKKDEVQKRFRDTINRLFDELKIDESKRNLLKFRTKMVSFSESSRGQNKMRLERDKYMSKLKQLENDLVLLDNNIGFFAKSKNAESLIEDVQRKIEQTKEKIEFLKNKIRVIDEMDTSEE